MQRSAKAFACLTGTGQGENETRIPIKFLVRILGAHQVSRALWYHLQHRVEGGVDILWAILDDNRVPVLDGCYDLIHPMSLPTRCFEVRHAAGRQHTWIMPAAGDTTTCPMDAPSSAQHQGLRSTKTAWSI